MTTDAQQMSSGATRPGEHIRSSLVNPHRRRNYFVDPATQLTITRQFVTVLFATAGLTLANYHVLSSMLELEQRAGISGALAYCYLLIMFLISLALLFLMCVFFSHRIAGPARKLCEALNQIAQGNLCVNVRLRDDDLLKDLAGAVNAASRDLRGSLSEVEAEIRRVHTLAKGNPDLEPSLRRAMQLLGEFQITNAASE